MGGVRNISCRLKIKRCCFQVFCIDVSPLICGVVFFYANILACENG